MSRSALALLVHRLALVVADIDGTPALSRTLAICFEQSYLNLSTNCLEYLCYVSVFLSAALNKLNPVLRS